MNTKVVTIKEDHIDEEAIQEAGQILKDGGLVAFPTETVYGLGGDALNAESSAKIYAAKGRPSDNPLIVHIADMDALPLIAAEIPESAYLLAGTINHDFQKDRPRTDGNHRRAFYCCGADAFK